VEQIKDIIPAVIDQIQIRKKDIYGQIQESWKKINSKNIFEHTAIASFNNGQLIIHVDSPTQLFQLKLQKQKLESQMSKEVPVVSKIYFKIGKVK